MDFRRQYHADFRQILQTSFYGDVVVLIDGLESWSMQDENLAMAVDRLDYWLQSEYTSWVTDPNDPEVKKAQAERKRRGDKPPPCPVIVPIAQRPQRILEPLLDRLARDIDQHQKSSEVKGSDGRRWGTVKDLRTRLEG